MLKLLVCGSRRFSDLVLAFLGGRETDNMVKQAKDKGVRTIEF